MHRPSAAATFLPCVELAVGGLPSPVSEKQLLCLPGHRQRECASAAERLARKLGCARRTADTNAAGGFTQPGVASAPRQHTLAAAAAVSRPHWQALAFAVRAVRGADAAREAPGTRATRVRVPVAEFRRLILQGVFIYLSLFSWSAGRLRALRLLATGCSYLRIRQRCHPPIFAFAGLCAMHPRRSGTRQCRWFWHSGQQRVACKPGLERSQVSMGPINPA